LKEAGLIDGFQYAHPKDIQDGKVTVTADDVLTNVPYAPGCGLWFDHHLSEEERKAFPRDFKGRSTAAPSCARVIYEYYGGRERFPHFGDMLRAVDSTDSGNLTLEEIADPKGWILLAFLMDPRTGLGRYSDYRISNLQLMQDLMEYCRAMSIEQIMELPDIKERIKRYRQQEALYKEMIKNNAAIYGNVLVIDLRKVPEIVTGNRFIEYAMFPEQDISIRVMWGLKKQNVVFAVGHSIVNRTSKTNVGSLMLKYGGGGHPQVGTCQVPAEIAAEVLQEMIVQMKIEG
ncbi:MAG: exopolyphosphatase, partial [Candidatus Edwardsbacteria bacterium]|nr:exopolyphosphatase [Candidatus Edwardsbacteria bacterium]